MPKDDLAGNHNPVHGEMDNLKRFEQAFDQALDAREFDQCSALLAEISVLKQALSVTDQIRIDLQEARLCFHQDHLAQVKELCDHMLEHLATIETRTAKDMELSGDVWALHGGWARRVGQIPQAIASYEESRSSYATLGLAKKIATIDHRLGLVYRFAGMWKQSIDHYQKSLDILESNVDPGELAALLNDLGNVYRLSGNLDKSIAYCKQSLSIRETLNNSHALGLSFNTLGMIYREMGQLEEAKTAQLKAIRLFGENRDVLGEARARNNLGYIYYRQGDLEQALHELEASLALLERLPDQGGSFLANTLDKLGRVRRDQGLYDQAMELFKRDLEIALAFQDYYQQAEARYELCVLYRMVGNWELLHAETVLARQLAEKYEYPYFAGRTWEIQGDVMLDRRMYPEAFADYRNALDEILKYTAKRYEELALRIAEHFKAIPDAGAQSLILEEMTAWAGNGQLEDRENRVGSEIHMLSLLGLR